MRNLSELAVSNVDYDFGFFWVEFENGKSLQCCLKAKQQDEQDLYENGPVFLEQVEIEDNGFYEGLSRENNEWAADEDGEVGHINDFLIEQARSAGLEIVA